MLYCFRPAVQFSLEICSRTYSIMQVGEMFVVLIFDICNVKRFQQRLKLFQFFTKNLTLSFPVPIWEGVNTDLPLNSNILKAVRIKMALTGTAFKEYAISFLMMPRLTDFALVVLQLLMFKVCGIILNFSGTERVDEFKLILCILQTVYSVCKSY